MSVLEKVRKWIDGESAETVLEEAARDAQIKPRSNAEEFIVKIARMVEEVMSREIVPLPQGTMIIPTEYIIFLSDEDDKEWQGVKRRGLEQGLYHILAERAKELSGKRKLETKSFAIELRVDGTLEKGDVRVQHSWDDSSANKTNVLPRQKLPSSQPSPQNVPVNQMTHQKIQTPNFPQNQPHPQSPPVEQIPPTVMNYNPPLQMHLQNGEPEEATRVQRRGGTGEIYRLEIWRGGVRQNIVPVFQYQLSIGRGSRSKPVDIPLLGDPEISRRHLSIFTDGTGNFWVLNEGKNPATINDFEIPDGQKYPVNAGTPISICSYVLRIQPK